MTISVGSLCSGYGGLDDAVSLATGEDVRHAWHAEIDQDASLILEKRFPGTPNLGDLLTADWEAAERPDILTAGFPCQPISIAGQQLAEADARWLWPGVRYVIRTAKPERVFLENVRNIVGVHKGAILRTILYDLRDAGYAARWAIFGACAVDACHHRHRWFLVADRMSYAPEAVRVKPVECGGRGRHLLPTPLVKAIGGRASERRMAKYGKTPAGLSLGEVASNVLPPPEEWLGHESWGPYGEAVARWETVTGSPAPVPTERGSRPGTHWRLNPALPEWMMGLAPGTLTDNLAYKAAEKLAGNGVVSRQAAAAYTLLGA